MTPRAQAKRDSDRAKEAARRAEIILEFAHHKAIYYCEKALGEEYAERLIFARMDGNRLAKHFRIDVLSIGENLVLSGDLGCAVFYYHEPRNLRSFSTYSVEYALEKVRGLSREARREPVTKERMLIVLIGMQLAFKQIDKPKAEQAASDKAVTP